MPESDDGGLGQCLADHARQQGKVVILHQHHRVVAVRFLDNCIGKALVDLDILLPVAVSEHRPNVGNMAQRPETFVGKAVIVALLLFLRKPDPAQVVLRVVGRHPHPVVAINCLSVGGAAAVGDPGSGTGPHDRLYSCNQAAGGTMNLDLAVILQMDVRLAVGDDDDPFSHQLFVQQRSQGFRAPGDGGVVGKASLGVNIAQKRAQVSDQWLKFRTGCLLRSGKWFDYAFAAQHRPDTLHPSLPAEMGNEHRNK